MGSPGGLWTAVSGGMAQSQNVDVIANNLANVNTTGFKKDTPLFKEYLTAVERPPDPAIDIPRTAFKDSDFYHHDGREHAMVNLDKMHTDHAQGALKPTNAPFDVAIDGPGFFAVDTPSGVMFTRAGDFKVNGQGQLVTVDGYPVLALSGDALAAKNQNNAPAPAAPGRNPAGQNPFVVGARPALNPPTGQAQAPLLAAINLRDALDSGTKVSITTEGELYSGDQLVSQLAVAEFPDPRLLRKTTESLYANPNPANVPRVADSSRVRQGFLEGSNVNAVSELLNLLKANRSYESNMRAIKAYNDMAGKEANEVGKL